MTIRTRLAAGLIIGGTVLAGGLGIATAANAATPSTSASASASSSTSHAPSDPTQAQLQQGASDFATKIATALKADVSTVTSVLQANHPTQGISEGGTPTRPEDNSTLINALAKATGSSASQVTAALNSLNASR